MLRWLISNDLMPDLTEDQFVFLFGAPIFAAFVAGLIAFVGMIYRGFTLRFVAIFVGSIAFAWVYMAILDPQGFSGFLSRSADMITNPATVTSQQR